MKQTRLLLSVVIVPATLAGCARSQATVADDVVDAAQEQTGEDSGGDPSETAAPETDASSAPDEQTVPAEPVPTEPVPFRPAGPVGDADAYAALIDELAAELPADLRREVPWPVLRNPDPVQAQLGIFGLWIWMAENHPEPLLAPAMGAEGSPSRAEIAAIFGEQLLNDELIIREQQPYRAFDHRVVTFESAGLPQWLARDVPDDAVVVYYQDESGPTTVRDRTTGSVIDRWDGVGARQWLSIMVPTDVGWLLYRDQLIEPGNIELPVPDQAPPAPGDSRRTPEV